MIAVEQTLAAALAEQPDMEPVLPFDAMVAGSDVMVTAVMERTAAYYTLGDRYDSHVIRLDLVLVDPVDIKWRTATTTPDGQRIGRRWNGARGPEPTTAEERQVVRDRTDQEALADQQRKAKPARRITPMPVATPELTAIPKTCRVCHREKPRDQFPKTGRNAQRCYACAALVNANEEKPLPIKRSIVAKAARQPLTGFNYTPITQAKPRPLDALVAELEQNRIRRGEILAELHLAVDHLGTGSA